MTKMKDQMLEEKGGRIQSEGAGGESRQGQEGMSFEVRVPSG